jgi:hypothetical protein
LFCTHVSQVIGRVNSLADFQAGAQDLTDFTIYKPFLAAHLKDRAGLLSALHAASATAPTTSLRDSLGALATRLESSVSFGGSVDTLTNALSISVEGLSPIYKDLGRQCPSSLSTTKPTAHQQAVSSALQVVRAATLIQAARGHGVTEQDIQQAIERSGLEGRGPRSVTLIKLLGGSHVAAPTMLFRATNPGGSWPVCVNVPGSPVDPISQVKVVTCTLPAGARSTGAE